MLSHLSPRPGPPLHDGPQPVATIYAVVVNIVAERGITDVTYI
jgi:hypothetical protein